MKTFKTALLITGILVAGLAFNSVAQTTEKGAPLEELYSYKHDKHKHKAKSDKHKAKVNPHAKHNKIHKNKSKGLLKAKARLNKEREI
jgi:hypothetical protein